VKNKQGVTTCPCAKEKANQSKWRKRQERVNFKIIEVLIKEMRWK